MDAAIDYQGDKLYYCNALFDFTNTTCVGLPCEAKIGVAQKVNDSTFNRIPNTDAVFSNVNDTNYLVYAPQVTKDGLELYCTRLQKGTFNTEICVSVRNSVSDTFSLPVVIHSNNGFVPEAATPSTDKQIIYYHQKDNSGLHKIFLRYRTGATGLNEYSNEENVIFFPNPANHTINVVIVDLAEPFTIYVNTILGQEIYKAAGNASIDISSYSNGIYFLRLKQKDKIWTSRFIKE